MEFLLALLFIWFCFYLIIFSFLKIVKWIFWKKTKIENKKYSLKVVWDKWDIVEFLVILKQKWIITSDEYKRKLDEIRW
jgi:hypothetical protein